MIGSSGDLRVPPHPVVLEIDTWPWLTALTEFERAPVGLGSVPPLVWDSIADAGYDLVWLMGSGSAAPPGSPWLSTTRT